MSDAIVIPGRSYGLQKSVTVSDTVNNLMSDDIPAAYLHNAGAVTADVMLGYVYGSPLATGLVSIPAGQYVQLSPHVRRVMSTGTTGGATLKALW